MRLRLQTKIFLLIFLVVLFSLMIAGYFITDYVSVEIESQISQLALDLARAVAEIPDIKNNVGKKDGHLIINPIAEEIRKKSKAEFIVVIDMESIRYSHPVAERIGQKFVGGDEREVFTGKEYVSRSVGTLGPSLRAFVPIYRDKRQVGAVSVGVLSNDVQKSIDFVQKKIKRALIWGLAIGFIGAVLLARNVKKAMFGLEPIEIATLVEEKQAILSSIREGIIAINKQGIITVMNDGAKKLLGLKEDVIGRPVVDIVPNTRLPEILATGKAEFDQDQLLHENRVLTNRVPIVLNNQVMGAVASFRDMTEIQKLAEELTGVKKYVDALRAQSHEFKNNIHTIAGLLQLGQYEKAIDFIMNTSEKQQDKIDILVKKVKDSLIGGLLIGKLALANELGIEFILDEESSLEHVSSKSSCIQLITVIGNLIDNAFDAVKNLEDSRRRVRVLIRDDEEKLYIEVEDWGKGIAGEINDKIYQQGFTTKGEENKGIGLTLVKHFVEEKDGNISWYNKSTGGVVFQIAIPKGRITG
ncbi:two-component system sensor histidine kinase DcuS [Thermanaerosceptrum fracticalcis]|uniref:histidine kinase n=1 Tax=Thermanaerosceptrum fracticalcis TaxID=1712410 RepID=A0A7G6E729_THEFR|nr:sensor histidine kinase [Thermanaerosceptrum fracticalcis]QNB47883.1 two-component system sensor histidine kinase DcuS [Thermanaerosceptrum fracticalcis]